MSPRELVNYLRSSMPEGYRDCELLDEGGWILVWTELSTAQGQLISVYVQPDECGYIVHDGGEATLLRQMIEGNELKPSTYAQVVRITAAADVRLDGLDLVIDGLERSQLQEAVLRMAQVIQAVTQIGESVAEPTLG